MVDVDYSLVAKPYALLERCVFGGKLQEVRVAHLGRLVDLLRDVEFPRVLVVGDGDGRFLQALLAAVSDVRVDYVDCSQGMLGVAKSRVANDCRVRWFCSALEDFEEAGYTAVSLHFLLDCYGPGERGMVVSRLMSKLDARACILVSDFDPSAAGARPWLLKLMQYFFSLSARYPIVKVEKDDAAFIREGAVLLDEKQWDSGWIYSQIWKIS